MGEEKKKDLPEQVVNDPTIDKLLEELKNLRENSVSKEEYEKALENNYKLTEEIIKNRPAPNPKQEQKEDTKETILKRCRARTAEMGSGNTYKDVKNLIDNYDDMQKLGMSVEGVDGNVVEGLRGLMKEANGDEKLFASLMENKIETPKFR